MIAATSIVNYQQHKTSGKLGKQSSVILQLFKDNPYRDFSRAEVSELLSIRLSSVCGRINELMDQNYLHPEPQRKCKITNKTVSPVKLAVRLYQYQLSLI